MQFGQPLLAFAWASPLWLWALGAVAIPLAIHLWRRQHPRVERWAAMQFLQAALERTARRMRIESLALLAARCLLLGLFALAMAGPRTETGESPGSGLSATHRILVMDGSASMGTRVGRDRRFDLARKRAREIVQAANPGDSFQLCRIGTAVPTVIIRRPAYEPVDLLREIDRLPLLDDSGDLVAAFRQVKELVDQLPPPTSIEIDLLTDRQRSNWSSSVPSEEAELRQLLREMGERARLVLIDLGHGAATDNLAVTALTVPDRVAIADRPLRVMVDLMNHTSAQTHASVEILADGVVRATVPASIAAGSQQTVTATLEIPESSESLLLEARIAADSMLFDNQFRRVVAARRNLEVLLVDGSPSDKLSESASGFIRLALAPRSTSASVPEVGASGTPYHVSVVSVAQLRGTDLSRAECIVLCDVSGLSEADATQLHQYVEEGGGLVIGLGPGTNREEFARTLGDPNKGLLPLELLETVDHSQEPVFFDTRDLDHPILELFRGRIEAGLATAPISRYVRAQLPPRGNSRVILPFTSGDPAVIEAALGQGRVLVVTTSFDDRWGHWVLWPSFVPLTHRMVMHSMDGRLRAEPLSVSSPLRQTIIGPVSGATVTLPSGHTKELLTEVLTEETGRVRTVLSWSDTGTAGVYTFGMTSPLGRRPHFAVNPDRRESDPQVLSIDQLRRGLLADVPFDIVNEVAATTTTVESVTSGSAWPRRLLGLVLGLLVIESLLAWRFRWGAWGAIAGLAAAILMFTIR